MISSYSEFFLFMEEEQKDNNITPEQTNNRVKTTQVFYDKDEYNKVLINANNELLIYREGEIIKNFGKISEISDDIFEKLSIKNNGKIVKCFTNNDKKDLFNGKFFRFDSLVGQQFELKKEIKYNDLQYFDKRVIENIQKKSKNCSDNTKKILDDRFEENLIHFYCCKENINESEIDRKEIIELIRTKFSEETENIEKKNTEIAEYEEEKSGLEWEIAEYKKEKSKLKYKIMNKKEAKQIEEKIKQIEEKIKQIEREIEQMEGKIKKEEEPYLKLYEVAFGEAYTYAINEEKIKERERKQAEENKQAEEKRKIEENEEKIKEQERRQVEENKEGGEQEKKKQTEENEEKIKEQERRQAEEKRKIEENEEKIKEQERRQAEEKRKIKEERSVIAYKFYEIMQKNKINNVEDFSKKLSSRMKEFCGSKGIKDGKISSNDYKEIFIKVLNDELKDRKNKYKKTQLEKKEKQLATLEEKKQLATLEKGKKSLKDFKLNEILKRFKKTRESNKQIKILKKEILKLKEKIEKNSNEKTNKISKCIINASEELDALYNSNRNVLLP